MSKPNKVRRPFKQHLNKFLSGPSPKDEGGSPEGPRASVDLREDSSQKKYTRNDVNQANNSGSAAALKSQFAAREELTSNNLSPNNTWANHHTSLEGGASQGEPRYPAEGGAATPQASSPPPDNNAISPKYSFTSDGGPSFTLSETTSLPADGKGVIKRQKNIGRKNPPRPSTGESGGDKVRSGSTAGLHWDAAAQSSDAADLEYPQDTVGTPLEELHEYIAGRAADSGAWVERGQDMSQSNVSNEVDPAVAIMRTESWQSQGSTAEEPIGFDDDHDFSRNLMNKFLSEFPGVKGSNPEQKQQKTRAEWLVTEAAKLDVKKTSYFQGRLEQQAKDMQRRKDIYTKKINAERNDKLTLRNREAELLQQISALQAASVEAKKVYEQHVSHITSLDEEAIAAKDRAMEKLVATYEKEIEAKNETIVSKEALLGRARKELKDEEGRHNANLTQMRQHNHDLNREIGQSRAKIKKLETDVQGWVTHTEGFKSQSRAEYLALEGRSKREIIKMQENHEAAIKQKDKDRNAIISEQVGKVVLEKEAAESKHKAALQAQASKHEQTETLLVQAHQKEIEDKDRKRADDLKELQEKLQADVDKLVVKMNEARDQAEKAVSGAAEQKRQLEADSAETLAQLTRKHEAERGQLEQNAERAREEGDNEVQRLTKLHNQRIAELEQAVKAAKDETVAKVEQMTTEHTRAMEELENTSMSDTADLRRKHREAQNKLKADYEQRMQQMEKEVQGLNEALLTKDEGEYQARIFSTSVLPSKPDEEIRKQFDVIKGMVEVLSRSAWKEDRTVWSPTVLERLSDQGRQLRKDILEDLIWTQLHRFIFCSPFHVFGDEGVTMEEEWNRAYGKGPSANGALFSWPVPSIGAELWRAFTVKGCRDTLRLQLSSHDPRAKVKKGYKKSTDDLVASLTQEFNDLVDTSDSKVSERIDKLCRQAASAWLSFGMFQCRIVISLTGAEITSTREKIARAQESSLELTIQPRVGRHGTVKGLELDSFTTLENYGGKSRVLPDEK